VIEGYGCEFAKRSDMEGWMALVDLVKDGFPGLDMADYRKTLEKNIDRGSAVLVRHDDEVVGVLLFSVSLSMLCCMAVHPGHRRKGLASAMIEKMLTAFQAGSEIRVTTFREGDPMGDAPRALYKSLGFQEGELVEEFGYPCQCFVLRKP